MRAILILWGATCSSANRSNAQAILADMAVWHRRVDPHLRWCLAEGGGGRLAPISRRWCSSISTSSQPLPTTFSDTENVRWSVPLGDGIGSPAVAAGRVFTSAMVDEKTIGLEAFEAATGKPLWRRTWPLGSIAEVHHTNSHAATTPAADAERVYFYSSSLGMLCVDAATGQDRWRVEMPVPYFVFKWGAGMSPVLHGDFVVFCQDDDLSPAIYAFDKRKRPVATGRMTVTTCARLFASGVLLESDRRRGGGGRHRHSWAMTWRAAAREVVPLRVLLRNIKTTPVCLDGIVYISLQSGGIAAQWIASIDQAETGNRDGKVTKRELQAFVGLSAGA